MYRLTLASELEGINEEAVSETHLEIIKQSDRERNRGAAVVESRDILCQENAQNRGDDVVHPQSSERQRDGLSHVEAAEQ